MERGAGTRGVGWRRSEIRVARAGAEREQRGDEKDSHDVIVTDFVRRDWVIEALRCGRCGAEAARGLPGAVGSERVSRTGSIINRSVTVAAQISKLSRRFC